jgi:hypothetical protein
VSSWQEHRMMDFMRGFVVGAAFTAFIIWLSTKW